MSDTGMIIELKGITAGYEARKVLHGIDLRLPTAQITGLVGPNGSGKSTLLRVIAGIHPASSGTLWCDGQEITHEPAHLRSRRGIGLLLPAGQVFPDMTVAENLSIAISLSKMAKDSRAVRDLDVMHLFPELDHWRMKPARLLSGGQRQMLSLSLILAQHPRVLLLDEPIEGLSQDKASTIMQAVTDYVKQTDATALLVEHNTSFVMRFSSVIHFMHDGFISHTLDAAASDTENRLVDLFLER